MGAIYISPIQQLVPESVIRIFERKGFITPPIELLFEEHRIIVFPKQLVETRNVLHKENYTLVLIGTCFYKNLMYEAGLHQILSDIINGCFNTSNLCGNYFILVSNGKKLEFIIDPASTQSIYFNSETKIVSSSFLACIAGKKEATGVKNEINKTALLETFSTGGLIGPDTLIEGIYRFESKVHSALPGISKIKLTDLEKQDDDILSSDLNVEVNKQCENLFKFFNNFKSAINEFGALSGITGGFDSRLLLFSLRRYQLKVTPFINERNPHSKQLKIAKEICQNIGSHLHHPNQGTTGVNLSDNFYFNDGLIRIYQIWMEETKSREYISKLYDMHKIGFSGIGGEQYRNSDYLLHKTYVLRNWIEGELIIKHVGNPFKNNSDKEKIIDRIERKINDFYPLKTQGKINFVEIKKVQNEIINNSIRTLRNNIENQLAFFISPFTEDKISKKAYSCIPFLGLHHKFEKKMIEVTNVDANHIETDYGYKLADKVPFKYTVICILKSIIGLKTYNSILFYYKNNSYISPEKGDVSDKLFKLNLPVKYEMLKNNSLIAPLIKETEFMLEEMQEFIESK